jgi:toxin CcdB
MAQFDLFVNPDKVSARTYPYLLEVQANLLSSLPTTVVVPLAKPAAVSGRPITGLNPAVSFDGREWLLMTQELAAMRRADLGSFRGSLQNLRGEVVGALDLLFIGI